jgi:hypothetical protein
MNGAATMSTLDQPTDDQLQVAKQHAEVVHALLACDTGAIISPDHPMRAGADALVAARLATSRPAGPMGLGGYRLTNRGLAAALRLLDDDR